MCYAVHIHYIPWSRAPFETNLCLSSVNQEICQGGCVTQASVTDAEKECKKKTERDRVAGNEGDMGSVFISHLKNKNIENSSRP